MRPSKGIRRLILPALLILLLLLLLLPPLWLGQYARAAADDYCYGIRTHLALQGGGSLWAAVWRTTSGYYQSWQGSFSALALMSLTPCILSERAYWLTPFVMLASLILGTVKLSDTLARRLAGGRWRDTVCLSVPLLICSIQFVPSPLNSFYWWNGAVYYTFFYGLSLLYFERFALLVFQREGRSKWTVLLPGLFLGAAVGGGNYVSALLSAMVGGCLWLWSMWRRQNRLPAFLLLCGELIPFLVNAAAPGNRVRQATVTGMSPLSAILAAIRQGAHDLLDWPNWITLLMVLFWVPLLWRLCGRSVCSFRYPALFCLLTFLIFAGQNTPHFYAASCAGPLRLRNIVFFSSFWFYLLNEWYLLGWLRRTMTAAGLHPERRSRRCRPLYLGALVLLLAFWSAFYFPATFTAGCLRECSNGSAAAYAAERDSRLPALRDPAVSDPVFPAIQSKPALLFQEDITPDPAHWKNSSLARYWGKRSVALEPYAISSWDIP